MRFININLDFIKQELYYDPESPSGLSWAYTAMRKHPAHPEIIIPFHKHIKGNHAGCLKSDGYWSINLQGTCYQCHRLVYSLVYGDIPEGMQIDHIDGNQSNNNILNLRAVDSKINCRNMPKRKRKSIVVGERVFLPEDIPTGVHWDKSRLRWGVHCRGLNGERITKYFKPESLDYYEGYDPVLDSLFAAKKLENALFSQAE